MSVATLATVWQSRPPPKDAASGNSATKSLVVFFQYAERCQKTREPFAAGGLDNPAAQFREFTSEYLELAQKTRSPEKRRVCLDLAGVCFQLALRCEKGPDGTP